MRTGLFLVLIYITAALIFCPRPAPAQESEPGPPSGGEPVVAGRVVFANARDIPDAPAAKRLVKYCREAGFNVLVLGVKQPDGKIYFRSEKFSAACAGSVKDFDPLAAVLESAGKEGLAVHAGLCAFLEGANSPPAYDYPERAARTPEHKNSAAHGTAGVWMCPAKRPGYADSYLIPLIEELLQNYEVDGIHLDHLSFPAGAGPGPYCFCDYCLKQFPVQSRLYYPSLPETRFDAGAAHSNPLPDALPGGTALPAKYDSQPRETKTKYMLESGYVKQGPADMDYFFYSYRTDVIRNFCSELFLHTRVVSPGVELSARCKWNAPAGGRFIGQRWTDFGQWFDFLVLDMGRDHLPGEYKTYRKLLTDAASYAAANSASISHIYAGLSVRGLYLEERGALGTMIEVLADLVRKPRQNPRRQVQALISEFKKIKAGLAAANKKLAAELEASIRSLEKTAGKSRKPREVYARLRKRLEDLAGDLPPGFCSPAKVARILKELRAAGVDSVALDGTAAIGDYKLWEKLPAALGGPTREPYQAHPLRVPSAQIVRLFLDKQDQLANVSAEIELLNQQLEEVSTEIASLRGRLEGPGQSGVELDKLLKENADKLDNLQREYSRRITELQEFTASQPKGTEPSPTPTQGQDQPLTDAHYETLRQMLEEKTRQLEIAQKARDAAEKLALEITAKSHDAAEDATYAKLRRMLKEKTWQLENAEKQRDAMERLALDLSAELLQLEAQLTEQKQEYLYYISFLIAVACLGLAVVLIMSLTKRRR